MNHLEAASLFLRMDVHINQQDINGNIALHYAVKAKNISMIQKLIKYGADNTIENNENESILWTCKIFWW